MHNRGAGVRCQLQVPYTAGSSDKVSAMLHLEGVLVVLRSCHPEAYLVGDSRVHVLMAVPLGPTARLVGAGALREAVDEIDYHRTNVRYLGSAEVDGSVEVRFRIAGDLPEARVEEEPRLGADPVAGRAAPEVLQEGRDAPCARARDPDLDTASLCDDRDRDAKDPVAKAMYGASAAECTNYDAANSNNSNPTADG